MSQVDAIDPATLRAAGVPITVLGGGEVRLIFDLDAIARIEEDFGSLGGMQDALEAIEKNGANSQFFGTVLKMLRAALLHDPSTSTVRFDTALVGDYFTAVMKATQLYFPKDDRVKPSVAATNAPSTTGSPGIPSITQEPFASVGATPNSGE